MEPLYTRSTTPNVFADFNEDGSYNGNDRLAKNGIDGEQSISYLPPGEYRFDVNTPTTTGGVRVNLKAGQSLIREIGIGGGTGNPVTVSGRLFADVNGNDKRDRGEPFLQGFKLFPDYLKGNNTVRSSPSGRFSVNVLEGMNLDLTPALGMDLTPGSKNYTIPASPSGSFDLGEIPLRTSGTSFTPPGTGASSISGFAFADLNGDRKRTTNEDLLTGYRVYLDLNGNGKYDPGETQTRVDDNGGYRFDNLASGLYRLRMTTFDGDGEVDLWDGRDADPLGRGTWVYVNGDTYRTLALQR
ncbi:MAG: hypothetical protein AAGD32_06380 [Planctomycetota bacterium]